MPVLNSQYAYDFDPRSLRAAEDLALPPDPGWRLHAFPSCANPNCIGGWSRLWRSHRAPVVGGGWLCSPACTHARVQELVRREQDDAHPAPVHRHRVPIGLVLLSQGWITRKQLRQAIKAQHAGSKQRLGEWLVAHCGLSEQRLTQALGVQWSCPAFSFEEYRRALPVTAVPRHLLKSFGMAPLRLTMSGALYLAMEDHLDHSLTFAVERMTGLRVISGLLPAGDFAEVRRRMIGARFPHAQSIEVGSMELLVDAFAQHIERQKPTESRIVRMRDLFWLRLWYGPNGHRRDPWLVSDTEDVIATVTNLRS